MDVIDEAQVQQLFAGETHDRLRRGIDVGVARPLKDGHHGGHRVGHGAEAMLAHSQRFFGPLPFGNFFGQLFRLAQGQDPRDDGDQRNDSGPTHDGRQELQHAEKPIDGPQEHQRVHQVQGAAGKQKPFEDPEGARDPRVLASQDVVVEGDQRRREGSPDRQRRHDVQRHERSTPRRRIPVVKPAGAKERREKVQHVASP